MDDDDTRKAVLKLLEQAREGCARLGDEFTAYLIEIPIVELRSRLNTAEDDAKSDD